MMTGDFDNPKSICKGDRLRDNDQRWGGERVIVVESVFQLGSKWYFRYVSERGRRIRVNLDAIYLDGAHHTQGYTLL